MSHTFLALLTLVLLLVHASTVTSELHYITPSQDSPCPELSSCLTLSQFASNVSYNEMDIFLLFLPGNHSLDREILLTQMNNFTMTKHEPSSETVFVECLNHKGRFRIGETVSVSINDLHFVGCGNNSLSNVTRLVVNDSSFQDVQENKRVLELNEVSSAVFIRCYFYSNLLQYGLTYLPLYKYFQRSACSGVLCITSSNVSVINSELSDNGADKGTGGTLVAMDSEICLFRNRYSNNWALFGGVVVASGSTITIDHNLFIHNKIKYEGGVMLTYSGNFTISNTAFNNNIVISYYGSVMRMLGDSSFGIRNITLANNEATDGSVMCMFDDSTFNITESAFTNNSAYQSGDVIYTSDNTSVIIDNCIFSKNTAEFGGVMRASGNSTFNITESTFTNNSAHQSGGVIYTFDDTSVIIDNCTFSKNKASFGGVMYAASHSSFTITKSVFASSTASYDGGAMYASGNSKFNITKSMFASATASYDGGVMYTSGKSSVIIDNCTFSKNKASVGGVMYAASHSLFNITKSVFASSIASYKGGVIYINDNSLFNITNSVFTSSTARYDGGVMYTSGNSSLNITNSTFTNSTASFDGGVMYTRGNSLFNITNSTFTNSTASYDGGVMYISGISSFSITKSTFTSSTARYDGGVMYTSGNSLFNITKSTFTSSTANNGGVMYTRDKSKFNVTKSMFASSTASYDGGVMFTSDNSIFIISDSIFTNNSANTNGGVMMTTDNSLLNIRTLDVDDSNFTMNEVQNQGGGIIFLVNSSMNISNSRFNQNRGSIYSFNSKLTLNGNLSFENMKEPINKGYISKGQEGGAITSFNSTVIFTGESTTLSNNHARCGGAILATKSKIFIHGKTTIANNTAIDLETNSSGGGISLKQSHLEIIGRCQVMNNVATRGGGIYASSSTVAVYQPGNLQVIGNSAELGGGMYLEINSKLYVQVSEPQYNVSYSLNFSANHATYGGAVYVADDSNSGACLSNTECFIQSLALNVHRYELNDDRLNTVNILFSDNTASDQGSSIFGGLLDRCITSPFAEVNLQKRYSGNGITYLQNLANINPDTISSKPVRLCFCNSEHQPNCSYQPPTIRVQKGKLFKLSLVAVDQVDHPVSANVTIFLSSPEGGFIERPDPKSVKRNCNNLSFHIFSPNDNETLNLYPNGPCGRDTPSTRNVSISFLPCICPIGFEPLSDFKLSNRCDCKCDSVISPYITCNSTSGSVIRKVTNSWIAYINGTDPYEYIIYSNCPFAYCRPQTENVFINFNVPNGADSQCAHNRTGVLCGACKEGMSLSLASSRCVPCHTYWPAVFLVIIFVAAIAVIMLVTALLTLNMTVSVGLINSFIFYANIVSVGNFVFFPSSEPSFPSVLDSWLNFDIGIDVCFIDGLDAYTKIWLQLVFPIYIISPVVIVIIVSECSSRFARLIGKKDPISTLATLILLSYAKLLSTTIMALSSAVLNYPDSKQTVWLPDGNVPYFQGKHIPLAIVAMLIIIIGLPYTLLLLLWQWIVCAPRWKVFNWTRNTKINTFISSYHVPHRSKYRFWTGLLLVVRVVLYITASFTISTSPQTLPLITSLLVGGLITFKAFFALRVYKRSFVDGVETALHFNLLFLAVFSLYDFKANITKQRVAAYTSSVIAFILLIVVIFYHVILLLVRVKQREEIVEKILTPIKSTKVTHSVIELRENEQGVDDQENRAEYYLIDSLV